MLMVAVFHYGSQVIRHRGRVVLRCDFVIGHRPSG